MFKKVLSFVLTLAILVMSGTVALAEQDIFTTATRSQIEDVAEKFVLEYNGALETAVMPEFDYVERNDDTILMLEMLRYKIADLTAFDDLYENMELRDDLEIYSYMEESGIVKTSVRGFIYYNYANSPDIESGFEVNYDIWFVLLNGEYRIILLDSNVREYEQTANAISSSATVSSMRGIASYQELVTNAIDDKIESIPDKVSTWNEFKNKMVVNEVVPDTRSLTATYSDSAAAQYARAFALEVSNGIFKPESADCTNFVSQCVWAGYGGASGYSLTGTISAATREALRQRVADNYRQTSEWYGRNANSTGDPTGNFRRVVEFWSYTTTNTGDGPRGTGYNNNQIWSNLAVNVQKGDVLQFYSEGANRYYHSVIVSHCDTANGYQVEAALDNVKICQHTGYYMNRSLRETLEDNGGIESGKMRLIRFKATTFSE